MSSLTRMGWRRMFALLELGIGGRAKSFGTATETLHRIVQDFEYHAADHLLITGDLTGYATEREFRAVREALGEHAISRTTCSMVPGNHDNFTSNAAREHRFESHFDDLLSSDLPEYCREGRYPFVLFKGEGTAIVGLNSARKTAFPGLAYGWVGQAQLDGLRQLLSDSRMAKRTVLVMVHHAPWTQKGDHDSPFHGMLDAKDLLSLLRGPRFALLHGHIHKRYWHRATATTPHVFCAGSSTQLGREGYWIIDVEGGHITNGQMHVPSSRPTR